VVTYVRGVASGEIGDMLIVEVYLDTPRRTGGRQARTMQDQLPTAGRGGVELIVGPGDWAALVVIGPRWVCVR
jgi:hypothetical protein